MKLFYLIVIFLLNGIAGNILAQENNGLTITGTVATEQGGNSGTSIDVFRDGQHFESFTAGNDGRFRVEVGYGNEHTLIFSNEDNFPQRIIVDTQMPQSVLEANPVFPEYSVNIRLLAEIPGVDDAFTQTPVMKIYYSEQADGFLSDVYFDEEQLKRVVEQAVPQLQKLNEESGQPGEYTPAEYDELKKIYDRLIEEAETEYKREEFLAALDGYKAASEIFPEQQYPKDRISEINDLLGILMVAEERDQALNERLQELLAQANAQYNQGNLVEARTSYQRVLSVDPDNSQGISRLNEIEERLKTERVSNEYDEIITAADNAFDELLYADARELYLKALELKNNENYPQQKIEEVDAILEELALNAEKLDEYRKLMVQAEQNAEQEFYEEALRNYEQAIDLKPGDEVATQKIGQLNELIALNAQKVLYDEQIKLADEAFQEERYEDALGFYEDASGLSTSEDYPISQIRKVKEIIAENEQLAAEAEAEKERLAEEAAKAEQARAEAMVAEKKLRYNRAMAEADSLFRMKDYESARTSYEQAMEVLPDEALPAQKIAVTDAMLRKQNEAQQAYDVAVANGDAAFKRELFSEARAAYREAQQVIPEEVYPAEMLARIDSVEEDRVRLAAEAEAAEQARIAAMAEEKVMQYERAIAKGDSLLSNNDYDGARNAYLSAQQVNPEEQLAGSKISELDELINQITATRGAYDEAIKKGDVAVGQELFEEARYEYEQAQQLFPEEDYPAEMIARIDSIEAVRAQLAAEAEAEKVRIAEETEAEMARQEAEAIVNQEAQQKAVAAEMEEKYDQAIETAAKLFADNDLEGARAAFLLAQQVKPEELLPGQRIVEIDAQINQINEAQQAYDDVVAKGDDAYTQESFTEARSYYEEAQQLKPDEEYPEQMLAEIDSIEEARVQLAAEEEAEKARQEALTEADNALLNAEAENAEKEQLAALEAEADRKYQQAVEIADSLFAMNDHEGALAAYAAAQQVKPGESLPEIRIDEINGLISRQSDAQEEYEASTAKGDEAFGQELFEEARAAYHEARQAKPEESYPGQMLARIDLIEEERAMAAEDTDSELEILASGEEPVQDLASEDADAEQTQLSIEDEDAGQISQANQAAEREMQYNYAISRADSHFNLKEYEQSLNYYNQAIEVNENADYPKLRISEINNILTGHNEEQKQKEKLEQDYNDAIQLANQHFEAGEFQQSRSGYERALELKPGETLPGQRIATINRLIEQQELDEEYNKVIMIADELFRDEVWEKAKAEYNNALAVKPGETYPANQLVKINNQIRAHEEKLLAEKQAAVEEERRKAELEEQQLALNESQAVYMAERTELYQEYIDLADESFGAEQFNVSRAWYKRASGIMPDEAYPKQRVEEINRIVKEIVESRQDNEYQKFIDLADSALQDGELAISRGWYNRALTVSPDASYPKDQLNIIAEQLAKRLANKSEEQVNSHLQQAAEAFAIGNYSLSRYWLHKALQLKPDNITARQKLEEVEKYLE